MPTIKPSARAVWVAGFSFGAWIGMQLLMRRPEIEGFISVAPPANMYDFSFLAPCPSDGLIVHGTEDDVVPSSAIEKLNNKLSLQKNIKITNSTIKGANHFFQHHMDDLTKTIEDYLEMREIFTVNDDEKT